MSGLKAISGLKDKLTEDMKTAMRSKDKPRLGVIRMALAGIKQREVDERIELDDTQVLAVLDKMLKQRKDSISQFETAGRQDLVDIETFEVGVLQGYLPTELTETEIEALVKTVVAEVGATSMQNMGAVMAKLKPQTQGRADMGMVSQKVKAALS